jgi:hypothetical protein
MHLIKQVEVEVQKVEKEVRITIHPEDDAEPEGLDEIFDEVSKVIGKELTLPAEGALSNLVGEVIRPWRKEIHEVIWAKDLSSVEIRFEPGVSKVRKEAITKWCGPALKRALKQAA